MNIQNAPQRPRVIVSLLLGLCTSLTPALASIVTTELTGNTRYDGWEGLNNSYYAPADHGSGYPGTSPWNEPMVATLGSATAEFMKISGSGFPATASMYSAAGGTFSVSGASPLADVETVVFSISIGAGTTEDVVAGPSLTLNGGATSIGAATHTWDLGSQQATIGGFEVTQTTYSYQWDLSSFGDSISSFDIQFDVGEHAQTYALQLDQSDSFSMANPSAIPEPSSLILLSLALLSGVVLRNRYFTKK